MPILRYKQETLREMSMSDNGSRETRAPIKIADRVSSSLGVSRKWVITGTVALALVSAFSLVAYFGHFAPGSEALTNDSASNDKPVFQVTETLRHKGIVTELAWSPDGKLLATTGILNPQISLWDTQTGQLVRALTREAGAGNQLAFTRDGQYLLSSAAKKNTGAALTLWDVKTGEIANQIAGTFPEKDPIYNAARVFALDPEQKLLALVAEKRGTIVLYDAQNWRTAGTLSTGSDIAIALTIAPGAKWLAAGTAGGKILLFDLDTREQVRTIDAYGAEGAGVESLAFSPDGQFIASGQSIAMMHRGPDGKFYNYVITDPIRIWKRDDGTRTQSFGGPLGPVRGLAWSPDGQYLASGNSDRTVRVWRVDSAGMGAVVTTFPRGSAFAVEFSPDGRRLAAVGANMAIVSEFKSAK